MNEFVLLLVHEVSRNEDIATAMADPYEFLRRYSGHDDDYTAEQYGHESLSRALRSSARGVATRIDLGRSTTVDEIFGKMECEYGTILPAILALKVSCPEQFALAATRVRERRSHGEQDDLLTKCRDE